jgi:ubiquinone/menaquinone biosynthesis C-methylase UbiE
METLKTIDARYSQLAKSSCCLACGGAINYAKPQEGEICVDLGSGRGNDCIRLAERVGPTGYVYGIDVSDGMLEAARRNAREKSILTVEFLKAPIELLPLGAGTIDLVISNCTINHAANKDTVWAEVFRVLKPGGRFVVSDIYALEPIPAVYRNDPVAVAECWAGAVTRSEYLQMLAAAGFKQVSVLEEREPYEKGKVMVASFTIRGYKP